MTSLVSVLIPAYNAERWLGQAVRSALAQSWPRIEIIIVDDGSTDATLETARAFESVSVKVTTQPNMGAVAARNAALSLAEGRYIQWLDADDVLHPHKVGAQMAAAAALADPHVLLSGSVGTFYYRVSRARFVSTSLWSDLTPIDYFLIRFRENVCFQTGAWLVSRELTEATGPWTDVHSPDDDGEYFCRMVARSAGVAFVPDAAIFYRVGNPGSLANARSHRAVTALFASKAKSIGYLLSLEDSQRTRSASLTLLQDWAFHLCDYEDVAVQSHLLARDLGGTLVAPNLKWKYKPIGWLFGYSAALRAGRLLPSIRAYGEATVDSVLCSIFEARVRR